MSKYARRVDENQGEIVDALRAAALIAPGKRAADRGARTTRHVQGVQRQGPRRWFNYTKSTRADYAFFA